MAAKVHQLVAAGVAHDAISGIARRWQHWLQEIGRAGNIYANTIEAGQEETFTPWQRYRPQHDELLIYHHGMGADFIGPLLESTQPLWVVHHNVTPGHYFRTSNPALAAQCDLGRAQLTALAQRASFGIGDSRFNEQELVEAGFLKTAVIAPVFNRQTLDASPQPLKTDFFEESGPRLLFVGRLTPNKRQEDLLKLLVACRRIDPAYRLGLVGPLWSAGYVTWIKNMVEMLGLGDALVDLPGRVSAATLAAYYQRADLFVSMSEHEGFCIPLLEAAHFKLPILAYRATAVPDTLGGAGMLFTRKAYPQLAEMVDHLIKDRPLRETLITGQTARLADFDEAVIKARFLKLFV